jgi:hypothetical protein
VLGNQPIAKSIYKSISSGMHPSPLPHAAVDFYRMRLDDRCAVPGNATAI